MSVVGFDDVRESGKFMPPLTTIRQDYGERAELAMKMLKALKEGACGGENVVLPVSLVERDSVQRVNAIAPFYSESNMVHLRRGVEALNAGKGVEHDIIEVD